MKIPHRKKSLFIPYMFALAVLLSAICFFSHMSGTSSVLSKALSFVTTPLQSVTRYVSSFVSSGKQYFSDVDRLLEENERLTEENLQLEKENKRLRNTESENDVLRRFLGLKKENSDYILTDAKIVSRSNSNYISSFTINKGSFHGIKENMPVITSTGALVGIVYSADVNSAKCMSVLSYDTYVGVYSEQSGETGLLSGSLRVFRDGKCLISGLADNTTIKEGDTVLTSGLGEIYPRDLKVGTVEGFIKDMASQTKSAVVVPDSSALTAENVMVLTGFERSYN